MILRLSDSLSRGLVVVAALLIGVWLSFFGIRSAIARYGAEGITAKRLGLAVRLESGNSEYWYLLGRNQQFNLEEPDSALAQQFYRRAIALNPLDTDAWLDLATDYELEGKNEEARQAYLRARKSYPASAGVAWRYGNFLLRQGDQREAYRELRRAIEADPQRAAAAFSRAYRANPDIDQILDELLPPRQSAYVGMIDEAVSEKQLAAAQTIWARLLMLPPHLEIKDFERLVAGLRGAREYEAARRVWDQGVAVVNLPPLLQLQGSVVWDPSFESGINGYSFAWQFKPIVQGVSIALDKTERHSGSQSLRLSFDGEHNPDLEAACTAVTVKPNTTYHLSGWVRTRALTTNSGIGFRIHSVSGSAPGVNQTPEFHDTTPWTSLDMVWTAGPQVHQASICIMREPSDTPNMNISGAAWVDDVNLVPQSAGPPKP